MDGKKLVLLGILVIAASAAFVYFDPLDMDLLGMKKVTTVAKPATPHIASKAVAPPPKKAPVALAPPAPNPTAESTAVIPAESIPVAKAEQAPQTPLKLSKEAKAVSKPATDKATRPKNLDLRFCLDMETNEAIAKCAGE